MYNYNNEQIALFIKTHVFYIMVPFAIVVLEIILLFTKYNMTNLYLCIHLTEKQTLGKTLSHGAQKKQPETYLKTCINRYNKIKNIDFFCYRWHVFCSTLFNLYM